MALGREHTVFLLLTIACGRTALDDGASSSSRATGGIGSNFVSGTFSGGVTGLGSAGGTTFHGTGASGTTLGGASSGGASSGGASSGGASSGGASSGGANSFGGKSSLAGAAGVVGGAGGSTCASPHVACVVAGQPKCVTIAEDPANCGSCGHRCATNERCASGTCIALARCTAPMTFGAPLYRASLDGTVSLKTADFDADGHLDVLATSVDIGRAEVFLGRGNGEFGDAQSLSVPPPISSWAIANFDRLGGVDILESHRSATSLTFWTVANGTLDDTSTSRLPNLTTPPLVKDVGDLNRDGFVDLLVSSSSKELMVWFGSSESWTFSAGPKLTLPQEYALLRLVDVNGDGLADVVGHGAAGISIWLGHGDGTFATNVDTVTNSSPTRWDFASLNGDAYLDVAVPTASNVEIWLGHADGTLTSAGTVSAYDAQDFAFADLNRDGSMDLVAINTSSRYVSIYLGLGNGHFGREQPFGTGQVPVAVTTGDFDGDGAMDVMLAVNNGRYLQYLRGSGDGTLASGFERFERYQIGPDKALAVGNLVANDALPDVVGISSSAAQVDLMTGRTAGGFSTSTQTFTGRFDSLVSADFDNDGRLDVAMTSRAQREIVVDSFNSSYPRTTLSDGAAYDTLAAGDLNGDGIGDLIAAEQGIVGARVLLGQRNHAFVWSGIFKTSRPIAGLAVADVDGDGKLDLLTSSGTAVFEVSRGVGDGTFQSVSSFSASSGVFDMLLADLNGDGDVDMVHSVDGGSVLEPGAFSMIQGLPGFAFEYPSGLQSDEPARRIALIDLNADGKQDLITTDLTSPQLGALLGAGDGTFQYLGQHSLPVVPGSLGVGDLDQDGKSDLVVSSKDTKDTIVIRNDCK